MALLIFLVRIVLPDANNPNTSGFSACYAESRILVERPADLAKIYDTAWFQKRIDDSFVNVLEIAHGQPPTMSLVMLPLAWLSPAKARAAWIFSSVLFWIGGLSVVSASVGLPRILGVPPAVWLAAVTSRYPPLIDNLQRGQAYALIFLLLCLAIAFAVRSGPRARWKAGVALGLMLALKSAGLWLCPLLVLSRQWRIVAAALMTLLAIVLALSPLVGLATWHSYLSDAPRWVLSEPSNYMASYQTVRSLAGHLFAYDAVRNPLPLVRFPGIVPYLTLAISAALLVTSARFHRFDAPSAQERALTLAMFTAPIVSVAPIGEGYHYMLVLPALTMAWGWAARAKPTASLWILLAASTLLVCVPLRYYEAPLLQNGWWAILAYPRVYGALGLWSFLLLALRVCAKSPATSTDRLREIAAAGR